MSHPGADERVRSKQVRAWLLALLRYAVTRENADRDAFLASAAELDRCGSRLEQPAFDFFTRSSAELCAALDAPGEPGSHAVLQRLIRRVDDARLRRALEAAIALEPAPPLRIASRDSRGDLWKGLASR